MTKKELIERLTIDIDKGTARRLMAIKKSSLEKILAIRIGKLRKQFGTPDGRYEILYQKNPGSVLFDTFRFQDYETLFKIDNPGGLEAVFYHMQGEIWSPRGEARDLIRLLGLRHTSMFTGDIVFDRDEEIFYMAVAEGFKEVLPTA